MIINEDTPEYKEMALDTLLTILLLFFAFSYYIIWAAIFILTISFELISLQN